VNNGCSSAEREEVVCLNCKYLCFRLSILSDYLFYWGYDSFQVFYCSRHHVGNLGLVPENIVDVNMVTCPYAIVGAGGSLETKPSVVRGKRGSHT
jgi:hypothetical protein